MYFNYGMPYFFILDIMIDIAIQGNERCFCGSQNLTLCFIHVSYISYAMCPAYEEPS